MSLQVMPCGRGDEASRRGFTLIELLVVVAIMTLLMAILVPSLSKARDQAKVVKTRGMMKAIGDGLEMFKTENDDECHGQEYPSSAAGLDPTAGGGDNNIGNEQICGAQWLVRYLMGKKLNGYVAKRNVPKVFDNDDPAWQQKGWYDNPGSANWPVGGPNEPLPRSGPYITSAAPVPPRDLPGSTVNDASGTAPQYTNWVFVDPYKMPICYYAANSRYAGSPNANIATWAGNSDPNEYPNFPGIYEFRDNVEFTGMCSDSACAAPAWNFSGSNAHINFGPDVWKTSPSELHNNIGQNTKSFPYALMDKQAWETTYGASQDAAGAIVRPLRSDSFILWSPGKDGVFGTADDVTNF